MVPIKFIIMKRTKHMKDVKDMKDVKQMKYSEQLLSLSYPLHPSNIYYTTPRHPFNYDKNQIITPICSRGYTGALILKLFLQNKIEVRDQYGIIADPKFSENTIKISDFDVTIFQENDEFEKVFGHKRNDNCQNIQTQIMKQMHVDKITFPNEEYNKLIMEKVWKFPTNKTKIFLLMTMDQREIDATIENLSTNDILVIFQSYNEVAYPPNPNIKAFSKKAYLDFIEKIEKYFVSSNSGGY